MRYKIIIILLTVCYLIVFPVNYINAEKSDEFIDHLSKKIYKDCRGEDIQIRQKSPLNIFSTKTATSSFDIYIEILPLNWPYTLEDINDLIKRTVLKEPFARYMKVGNTVDGVGVNPFYDVWDGEKYVRVSSEAYHLFNCGDKFLDVNDQTYIWDGKVVELPKYSVKFSVFEIGGISILSIGLSFCVIKFIIRKRKKREDRKR